MRASGIIRRVDDLGRVVIPKEIRHQLKITEGTPLEIFLDYGIGGVTFVPYHTSAIPQLKSLAAVEYEAQSPSEGRRFREKLEEIIQQMETSKDF